MNAFQPRAALTRADRDELFRRPPVRIITKGDPSIVSWHLRHQSDGTHSQAKASYFDGDRNELIEAEAKDGEIRTGDTLRLDERVENKSQAEKLARSRLQRANMGAWSGSLEFYGDPSLQSGMCVQLAGFGRFDRKYIIMHDGHRLTPGGYLTTIEIEDARTASAPGAGAGA